MLSLSSMEEIRTARRTNVLTLEKACCVHVAYETREAPRCVRKLSAVLRHELPIKSIKVEFAECVLIYVVTVARYNIDRHYSRYSIL